MRDHQRGAAFHRVLQRELDRPLRMRVERAVACPASGSAHPSAAPLRSRCAAAATGKARAVFAGTSGNLRQFREELWASAFLAPFDSAASSGRAAVAECCRAHRRRRSPGSGGTSASCERSATDPPRGRSVPSTRIPPVCGSNIRQQQCHTVLLPAPLVPPERSSLRARRATRVLERSGFGREGRETSRRRLDRARQPRRQRLRRTGAAIKAARPATAAGAPLPPTARCIRLHTSVNAPTSLRRSAHTARTGPARRASCPGDHVARTAPEHGGDGAEHHTIPPPSAVPQAQRGWRAAAYDASRRRRSACYRTIAGKRLQPSPSR